MNNCGQRFDFISFSFLLIVIQNTRESVLEQNIFYPHSSSLMRGLAEVVSCESWNFAFSCGSWNEIGCSRSQEWTRIDELALYQLRF